MNRIAVKESRMQKRRKKQINTSIIRIVVVAILIFALLYLYFNRDCEDIICYKENSNVDYKVYLENNEFYENNYVEKDNRYIASLIKEIVANFNYELEAFESGIDYNYSYRVEAEVNVKETKNKESIYNFKEELLTKEQLTQNSNENLKINEDIKIDYNHYNDIIKKFVSVYGLDDIDSTLKVSMYITADGICKEIKNGKKCDNDEYVVSLEMPLTTKTIAIEINSDIVKCRDEVKVGTDSKSYIILSLAIILSIIEVYLIITLIEYIKCTKTPEDVYKNELNKILDSYGEFIQRINNEFDISDYKLVYLDIFDDMLKIRDTIQEPILMKENKENNSTYFMIPGKTNILYIYKLNIDTMKK